MNVFDSAALDFAHLMCKGLLGNYCFMVHVKQGVCCEVNLEEPVTINLIAN